MPELPEVETIKSGLLKLVIGKTIRSVEHDWPKGFPNSESDVNSFLIGAKIVDVRRRAKILMIDLDSDYSLMIHLKMTGQLVYVGENFRFGAGHPNASLAADLPDKSTRVVFGFIDNTNLYFNDQRKFGWIKLLPTASIPETDFMKKVGPEPFDTLLSASVFIDRIQRRKNTSIKAALLDQSVIAGIGNIYADEALWGAKIHPATLVRNVSHAKLKVLLSEIRYVLKLSIEKGGSTDRNYVNAEGIRGSYMDFARVFRKEGTPCLRHPDTLIIKIRVAGRGTHICPRCQKL